MSRYKVVVTGAGGFVGSALRRIVTNSKHLDLEFLWVFGTRDGALPPGRNHTGVHRDLRDPANAASVMRGADALVHLAHRVSGPADELEAVNHHAAAALTRSAHRNGAARIVALSTLAVFGHGPFLSRKLHDLTPRPMSIASATRLRGDEIVLDHGGTVVTPHFILGQGDTWVLPRAVEITRKIGLINGGRARHTVVDVEDLAADVFDAALPGHDTWKAPGRRLPRGAGVITVRDLVRQALADTAYLQRDISASAALRHALGHADRRWEHDIALLSRDHVILE